MKNFSRELLVACDRRFGDLYFKKRIFIQTSRLHFFLPITVLSLSYTSNATKFKGGKRGGSFRFLFTTYRDNLYNNSAQKPTERTAFTRHKYSSTLNYSWTSWRKRKTEKDKKKSQRKKKFPPKKEGKSAFLTFKNVCSAGEPWR